MRLEVDMAIAVAVDESAGIVTDCLLPSGLMFSSIAPKCFRHDDLLLVHLIDDIIEELDESFFSFEKLHDRSTFTDGVFLLLEFGMEERNEGVLFLDFLLFGLELMSEDVFIGHEEESRSFFQRLSDIAMSDESLDDLVAVRPLDPETRCDGAGR